MCVYVCVYRGESPCVCMYIEEMHLAQPFLQCLAFSLLTLGIKPSTLELRAEHYQLCYPAPHEMYFL